MGTIFNDDAEGEDKEREKKKGEEIGCEGGCSFSEKLRRTAKVIEARVVVGHGGGHVGFAGFLRSTAVRGEFPVTETGNWRVNDRDAGRQRELKLSKERVKRVILILN